MGCPLQQADEQASDDNKLQTIKWLTSKLADDFHSPDPPAGILEMLP